MVLLGLLKELTVNIELQSIDIEFAQRSPEELAMLPPHPHRSPRYLSHEIENKIFPMPNRRSREKSPFRQQEESTVVSQLNPYKKYDSFKTGKEKRKALGRVRYINQLAQLDYEEKHQQVHTKYSMVSKASALKKIKAKNQMAEFEDEEEEEQIGFEELMDYKYGRSDKGKFHFEKEQILEYEFCSLCDGVHNDHPEVHEKVCREKRYSSDNESVYGPREAQYRASCLGRLVETTALMNSQEYSELNKMLLNLREIESANQPEHLKAVSASTQLKALDDLQAINQRDLIFAGICKKVRKVFSR